MAEESESKNRQRTPDAESVAEQIRTFADQVEAPEKWVVTVPVDVFDDVVEMLDTEYDLGVYYEGVSLCYEKHDDEVRVQYRSGLSEHLDASGVVRVD